MRKALLDTDILSEILKGKNETVRQRAAAYQARLGDLTICAVTVMEVVRACTGSGAKRPSSDSCPGWARSRSCP
jgi:predicted nucleic acid-binding protein